MSVPEQKRVRKRPPRPNNPYGLSNERWLELSLESQQHAGKWIVWSPGHDKILAVADKLMDLDAEVERLGYDVHDVIYQRVEPPQYGIRPKPSE